jgi:hypothetical protein
VSRCTFVHRGAPLVDRLRAYAHDFNPSRVTHPDYQRAQAEYTKLMNDRLDAVIGRANVSEQKKTICLDFDGVLHSYKSGWLGEDVLEQPMESAQDFCRILKQDFEVVIASSRAQSSLGYDAICDWLTRHNFPFMPVHTHKPMAVLYVDDRGFRFTGDFGDVLDFIKDNPGLPSGSAHE